MTRLNPNLFVAHDSRNTTPAAHLVGARGTGMKALGELLVGLGWKVTGSDISPGPDSGSAAIPISRGHDPARIRPGLDVLVHTPAVDGTNAEVSQANSLGIPCLTYPEMLGELMNHRRGIAVCGTHGKSTTTALLGWILAKSGLSPSVAIGAEFAWPQKSGWAGNSNLFVVEACEYRRAFSHLAPEIIIALGCEPDHFDCFGTQAEMTSAYADFFKQLPSDGLLIANFDCRTTAQLADEFDCRVTRFSRSSSPGWRAEDVVPIETGVLFRVCHNQHHHSDIHLPLYGRHQVTNALAAISVASELGVRATQIESAIESFPGLRRRFEHTGTYCGVEVLDDYAHHPTAVTATIRSARQKYPHRPIVAVFEPHQHSRLTALFDDFVDSLSAADRVIVAPIFTARESVSSDVCDLLNSRLATEICGRGTPAVAVKSLDHALTTLDDSLLTGDVLLTMGAGNIERVSHEFTGQFQRYSEAG